MHQLKHKIMKTLLIYHIIWGMKIYVALDIIYIRQKKLCGNGN